MKTELHGLRFASHRTIGPLGGVRQRQLVENGIGRPGRESRARNRAGFRQMRAGSDASVPNIVQQQLKQRQIDQQWVRFGVMGQVRPFRGEGLTLPRGTEVVLRTSRGLEWGTVLTAPTPLETAVDGTILRPLSPNDRLLIQRIEKNKLAAIRACQQKLQTAAAEATLVDLELLFDGKTLIFYFLGPLDETIERITVELAEVFETKVQFRKFTTNVLEGCGPDCGTGAATGNCSDCTSCAIATACGKSQIE